jgi:hypothetical protein
VGGNKRIIFPRSLLLNNLLGNFFLPPPLQFSLPAPKGGRAGNIVLVEDQKERIMPQNKVFF